MQTIGICSVNREEWLVTDLACNLLDITSVPLYETLGDEILQIILDQTEMSTLFGTEAAIKSILTLLQDKELKYLKQIVLFDKEITPALEELAKKCGLKTILYWT